MAWSLVCALLMRPAQLIRSVNPKSPIERAPGVLPREIENEVAGGDKARVVAGEDLCMANS
jgi:hypothetical protein